MIKKNNIYGNSRQRDLKYSWIKYWSPFIYRDISNMKKERSIIGPHKSHYWKTGGILAILNKLKCVKDDISDIWDI